MTMNNTVWFKVYIRRHVVRSEVIVMKVSRVYHGICWLCRFPGLYMLSVRRYCYWVCLLVLQLVGPLICSFVHYAHDYKSNFHEVWHLHLMSLLTSERSRSVFEVNVSRTTHPAWRWQNTSTLAAKETFQHCPKLVDVDLCRSHNRSGCVVFGTSKPLMCQFSRAEVTLCESFFQLSQCFNVVGWLTEKHVTQKNLTATMT